MVLFQEEFGQEPVIPSCSFGPRKRINPVLGAHAWNSLIDEMWIQVHQRWVRILGVQHTREVQSLVILPTGYAAARFEIKHLLETFQVFNFYIIEAKSDWNHYKNALVFCDLFSNLV